MSQIIEFNTSINPTVDSLLFSVPVFNGIRVISPETVAYGLHPPYYGDTVNIGFWKRLHLKIGGEITSPIYHLQEGYIYKYIVHTHTFIIKDETGVVVETITNVQSMGDMKIDFNIYKSHQLEILILVAEETLPFYISAELVRDSWLADVYKELNDGINNTYLADSKRPYSKVDEVNPARLVHFIDGIASSVYFSNTEESGGLSIEAFYGEILKILGTIYYNWDGFVYATSLVNNEYSIFDGDILNTSYRGILADYNILFPCYTMSLYPELMPVILNTETINNRPVYEPWMIWGFYKFLSGAITGSPLAVGEILDIKLLLPCYTMSLYPELMPVILNTETINNRPVYEPWMIWGFYKFLYSKKYEDGEDEFSLPVFDLSPNWG